MAAYVSMALISRSRCITALDNSLSQTARAMLENCLVAPYFPPVYYLAMAQASFRDRILAAKNARNMSTAELSRRSGVPYHALDKYLKREGATTSAENAQALANVLGVKPDGEDDYDELREMFFRLDEEKRRFVVASVRGLLG